MRKLPQFFICVLLGALISAYAADAPASPPPSADVCVIIGTPGDDSFVDGFAAAANKWQDNCKLAHASCTVIGLDDEKGADPDKNTLDHDKVRDWVAALEAKSTTPVWIVYIGHGTFDGKDARMNLRGVDISATEMATMLKNVKRPLVFVDGGSCSAPFINALSAPNRIIISATQTGREVNYARFGEQFAVAITDPAADLDQDGQVSVLEAFVTAEQRVQDFYSENDRMATEHALIDDNGDKRGTPANFFQGTRLIRQPQGNVEPDGEFSRNFALVTTAAERALTDEQRSLRSVLESQIESLRAQKENLGENEYYTKLEALMRQLQPIYVKTPTTDAAPAPAPAAASGAPAATSTSPAQ
ncbi:MAG TPA: hypothetical protein VK737_03975 [Opitutales bacterium]|jgi:hypothetical protein|nr:hypothetical protein [Opitutales bacterium]